jgi:hypothetical protein
VVCCGLAGDITSRSFFDFRRRKRSRSGIIETEQLRGRRRRRRRSENTGNDGDYDDYS